MSTGIKYLSYDGLSHFLDKLKNTVLSKYMPLNNYTFEYITNNETTNDIVLRVNRANPQLFRWLIGNNEVYEPFIRNIGPIKAYSIYINDLSIFAQQDLVISMGGGTTTYNPFPYTPTIDEVFERILICVQPYNWSGHVHYTGHTVFLFFTYYGIDTNMDLDISPAGGLLSDTNGDKYYDVILNYNEIYNYYTTGDTQSLVIGNVDLPLAFTQRTFDNSSLQLFEDSSFELMRWINLFGNYNSVNNYSIRQNSIICSDTNNNLIINNNLLPQDSNTLSLGDSDYMFSYIHAMDFCERGVMLRDTYLKKSSIITYADIDNILADDD